MHWRRKWKPTPVFLPGESQGRRSLVGCRLWGRAESTRLKRLSSSSSSTRFLGFALSHFLFPWLALLWVLLSPAIVSESASGCVMCPLVSSSNIHPLPPNALFRVMAPVWVWVECYNKIPKTEWLKQYTFMSHSSGGWEVQDQGASRFGFWWEPSSWISHVSVEKEMATHSSILSWKVPQTEEAGGLQSMGRKSWTWLSD